MKNFAPFILLVFIITSCSGYKEISYFQDLEAVEGILTEQEINYSLTIRPDDELSIIVSAKDPELAAPFNLPVTTTPYSRSPLRITPSTVETATNSKSTQPYIVDSNGYINFPVLGKIKASGMTREELTLHLEKLLAEYIDTPIVNVNLLNFQISVLGEVNQPGTFNFNKQRVSILEAIAAAGDMKIHGQRENVFIARDINGQKEYFKMDLTKSDIFRSDKYYLQQNDMVYILPNKEMQRDAGSGAQKQFNLSIIVSAVSSVISIIAIITR